MKRWIICASLAIAVIVFCQPHAYTQTRVMVLGHGNRSCGTWLSDRRADSWGARMQESWVVGFVTAHNETTPGGNLTARTDINGLFAWLDGY
jgi:hypothetical protein